MTAYIDFKNRVFVEEVSCKRATDKAILCDIPELGAVWIPQSQIDDDSEVYKAGDEGTLVISQWIADQKKIPYE